MAAVPATPAPRAAGWLARLVLRFEARDGAQAAARAEGAWVYAARFPLPAGGSLRLDGLPEDALQAP